MYYQCMEETPMLSQSHLGYKTLPELVIEFDQVLNGAMNASFPTAEIATALAPYINRMKQIQEEVVLRQAGARQYQRQVALSQAMSYMETAICNQKDRIDEVEANADLDDFEARLKDMAAWREGL